MTTNSSRSTKDFWDKVDILLKPLGGLFTGIALAVVGYFTTNLLEQQQAEQTRRLSAQQVEETNRRLYTEIMSSREKADSDLRKEMFNAIINAFLDPDKAGLKEKVLALELLAYNFHNVIDLSPVFKYIAKEISASDETGKDTLNKQLERVAREVIAKQLATLSDGGIVKAFSVNFAQLRENALEPVEHVYPLEADKPSQSEQRYILVEVLEVFPETREVKVRLESGLADNKANPDIDVIFKVGFFDFPMIDNTRLSHAQRVSIALTRWNNEGADLALVYFPASRASLKEKMFYDEVIEQLHRSKVLVKQKLSGTVENK